MEHDSFLLYAFTFDGKGKGEAISEDAVAENMGDGAFSWLHMHAEHPGTRAWLEQANFLDSSSVDALLAPDVRPRLTVIGDAFLIVLRGVNLNENADPEDMVSIRIWMTKKKIISTRLRKLMAVQDIKDRILKDNAPHDPGEFLASLTTGLFERMYPFLENLSETIDRIEEEVLENPNKSLRKEIIDIRRQSIILRRYMAPQRDVVAQLRDLDHSIIKKPQRRQLQENYDRVTRYVEDLDLLRERSQIVQDELSNIFADRMNKNMYILSVIASIFLPLGFLTGLFGVNLAGIPGAENSDAFWHFSGILLLIIAAQIVIFKKLKWF